MKRRNFLKRTITAGSTAIAASTISAPIIAKSIPGNKFKKFEDNKFTMNYAPHFGMFKNMAGDDLIDQIKFMADAGFTAMEDNGMKSRTKDMQEKIASEMARLNMKMGVFVAHAIDWEEPNLTTGDKDMRARFLKEIEESVEVAKRVNATWMTVVPGFHTEEDIKRLGEQLRAGRRFILQNFNSENPLDPSLRNIPPYDPKVLKAIEREVQGMI